MSIPIVWFGSAESYQQVLKAHEWGLVNPDYRPPGLNDGPSGEGEDPDDEEETFVEYLAKQQITQYDNVGVLAIDGPLVNEESFFNLLFGLISYNTISTALNMLLEDEEITEIVLNMSTPGGDSQGIEGLSTNIEEAKKLKPITAWSGTSALSAGYWLAASADLVSGAKMSEFGSIGVITTATNYAEMLKKEGVEVEIIRAGKYKAPVHPAEKLSDRGREILEDKTDRLYQFFLGHVARNRTLDISNKDQWAEGRVFFAAEAIPVGLVDEIVSLNELVSRLTVISEPTGDDPMAKQVILSEESRAKLASGAKLEDLPHTVVGGMTDEEKKAKLEADEKAKLEADEKAKLEADEKAKLEAGKPGGEPNELQTYLQSELDKVRAELVDAKAESAKLSTRANEMEEQNKAFLGIAVEATHHLQIALGQTPVNLAEMPASTVITYYSSCRADYNSTFKVGRTSLDAEGAPKNSAESEARALGITPVED